LSIETKMAWRNVWRNPRRTILTVGAITFAGVLLVFMLSFQFGSYETMINTAVKISTGHLQIQAEKYVEKNSIHFVIPHPEQITAILNHIPEVAAYALEAQTFALISSNDRTYGAVVTGVDPQRETKVSRIQKLVRKGNFLTADDVNQAVVGSLLAKNLRVTVGDELTLLGQGRDGSIAATVVRVKGIFSSGIDAFDRSTIEIPLTTFQQVFSMGDAVHAVVIIAKSLSDVSGAKAAIQAALSDLDSGVALKTLDWQELMPGLRQAIEMDLVSGLIFYGLLIIVVAFSILNTFLMAIFERTKEFGVMMAIGTTPRRLTKVLLIESMSMTAVGILAGILLGIGVTYYFQIHGLDFGGGSELLSQFGITGRMYPKLSLLSVSIGPCMVLFFTFMAALYPALKVRRLRPVEAMMAI
jgi:putative ABC transport system permease protein